MMSSTALTSWRSLKIPEKEDELFSEIRASKNQKRAYLFNLIHVFTMSLISGRLSGRVVSVLTSHGALLSPPSRVHSV